MRRLIVFDIDGTLTATTDTDDDCYSRALIEHLGAPVNTDWASYQHVTDAGIAMELLTKHGQPASELAMIREQFIALLMHSLRATHARCAEIPGAGALLQRLRRMPGVSIGIATGGWRKSAMAKLQHAGIDIAGLAFASSDDASSRVDILGTCYARAADSAGEFTDVTYVGDGVWDAMASHTLGWRFVGVGSGVGADRLRMAGCHAVIADYLDFSAVLKAFEIR